MGEHIDLPGVKFLERANFTRDETRAVLEEALAATRAITDADPSPDAVYAAAVSLLSNKQVIQVQTAAPMALDPRLLGGVRH